MEVRNDAAILLIVDKILDLCGRPEGGTMDKAYEICKKEGL